MTVLYNYLDAQGNLTNDAYGKTADGGWDMSKPNQWQGRADGGGNGDPSLGMSANGGNYITSNIPTPGAAPAPAPATPMPLPGVGTGNGGNGGAVFGGGASGGGSSSSGGILNSGYAAGSTTPATLGAATNWNVTPEQTVAGQVQKLVAGNSPILEQARTRAKETMNSRGLLNSALAGSAADSAVYDAALQIATPDAATYGKAAGYNADQNNQLNQLQYTQGNQVAMANAGNATQLAGAQISSDTQKYTAQLAAQSNQLIKQLDTASQEMMANEANKNKALLQNSQNAASAYQQYAATLVNIQTSNTMDENAKAIALANARNAYQFAMQASYKLAGADIPDFGHLLDFGPGGSSGLGGAPAPAPAPSYDQNPANQADPGGGGSP